MEQFENGTRTCPCHPACEEDSYPASVSSVTWPNREHQVKIRLQYVVHHFSGNCSNAQRNREREPGEDQCLLHVNEREDDRGQDCLQPRCELTLNRFRVQGFCF